MGLFCYDAISGYIQVLLNTYESKPSESNPASLTFNFVPKIIFSISSADNYNNYSAVIENKLNTSSFTKIKVQGMPGDTYFKESSNGKTVYFYGSYFADWANYTYYYYAIS